MSALSAILITLLIGQLLATNIFMLIESRSAVARSIETTTETALSTALLPAALSVEYLDATLSSEVAQSLITTDIFDHVRIVSDFGDEMAYQVRSTPTKHDYITTASNWLYGQNPPSSETLPLELRSGKIGSLTYSIEASAIVRPAFLALLESFALSVAFFGIACFGIYRLIQHRLLDSILDLSEWMRTNTDGEEERNRQYGVREVNFIHDEINGMIGRRKSADRRANEATDRQLELFELTKSVFERTSNNLCLYDATSTIQFSCISDDVPPIIRRIIDAGPSDRASLISILHEMGENSIVSPENSEDEPVDDLIYSVEFPLQNKTRVLVNGIRLAKGWYAIAVLDVSIVRRIQRRREHIERVEALGRVSSGVAHEFNNLLAIIISNLELITLQQGPDHSIRNKITETLGAADRASKIVAKLLGMSHSGVSEPRIVSVRSWLEDVTPLLRTTVGPQVTLRTNNIPDANIKIDTREFDGVLINLAKNAREAMNQSGTITIEVEVVSNVGTRTPDQKGDNELVSLTFTDTGSGIKPENLEKIFDPFFTTKRVNEGLGLGMVAVVTAVERANGDIEVSSEVGKGTKFRICLPAQKQQVTIPQAVVVEQNQTTTLEGRTVLLLEDEPALRQAINSFLQLRGAIVTDLESVESAKRACASQKFDLLLFDQHLPDGSGLELLKSLDDEGHSVRAILMSGASTESWRARSFPMLKLTKPVRLSDLETACIDLL